MEDRNNQVTMELARFKTEHFTLMSQTSEQARKLEAELESMPNYEYIKNVLLTYFSTNEVHLQANLIRVVFETMKFTTEEQTKVKDSFNANNMSYVNKMTGAKLI